MNAALLERLENLERRLGVVEAQIAQPAPNQDPESRIAWQGGWRPRFWRDVEVRRHVINRHGQTTLAELHAEMLAQFGEGRAPSRSAIARLWQRIDQTARKRRAA